MEQNTGSFDEAVPHLDDATIEWTASEYLHHQKSAGWYSLAVMAIVLIAFLAYILMREFFSPFAVVLLGGILVYIGARKPRVMHYLIDSDGIVVGSKEFLFDDFLSFSVMKEDGVESIMLIPQKRWSPALTIYFDPKDGQKIFDTLSTYLPFEQREKDSIDKFLHRIKF